MKLPLLLLASLCVFSARAGPPGGQPSQFPVTIMGEVPQLEGSHNLSWSDSTSEWSYYNDGWIAAATVNPSASPTSGEFDLSGGVNLVVLIGDWSWSGIGDPTVSGFNGLVVGGIMPEPSLVPLLIVGLCCSRWCRKSADV